MTLRRRGYTPESEAWDMLGVFSDWHVSLNRVAKDIPDIMIKKLPANLVVTSKSVRPNKSHSVVEGHVKKNPKNKFRVDVWLRMDSSVVEVKVTLIRQGKEESERERFNATFAKVKAAKFANSVLEELK